MTSITVAIPTYNRVELLKEALESVCQQTFQDIEILVCDNCSNDGTEKFVSEFPDRRVRYHRNEKNIGQFGNISRCIELTTTPYWALLMDDDLWHPSFLEVTLKGFDLYPQAALSTCPVFEGENPSLLHLAFIRSPWAFLAPITNSYSYLDPKTCAVLLFINFPFHPSGFVVQTTMAKRFIPLLYGTENWGGDYYFAAQCGLAGGIVFSPLGLVFARRHPGTETSRIGREIVRANIDQEVQERIVSDARDLGIDVLSQALEYLKSSSPQQIEWLVHYLHPRLKSHDLEQLYLRVTELAFGLPYGRGQEYWNRWERKAKIRRAIKGVVQKIVSYSPL